MALSDVFNQGNKLGMFTYGQPQVSDFRQSPGFLNLPKEKQQALEEADIKSQIEARATGAALAPYLQQPYTLDELGRFREQEAIRAQKLGKESLGAAFTYSTLANIPKNISQAFGSSAVMKLLAGQSMLEGGKNILNAYANMQLPAPPMYQSQKYFG